MQIKDEYKYTYIPSDDSGIDASMSELDIESNFTSSGEHCLVKKKVLPTTLAN